MEKQTIFNASGGQFVEFNPVTIKVSIGLNQIIKLDSNGYFDIKLPLDAFGLNHDCNGILTQTSLRGDFLIN